MGITVSSAGIKAHFFKRVDDLFLLFCFVADIVRNQAFGDDLAH